MSVIYPSPTSSAYVLLRKWHTIVVYRLEGVHGFQKTLTLETGEPINWMQPTLSQGRRHLLAMFYGDADCTLSNLIGTPAKLVLLTPKYRQEVLVKQNEVLVREKNHLIFDKSRLDEVTNSANVTTS